jgi:hypothetical protein
MKVFGCKCDIPYGGGLILVAANTREEAFSVASVDEDAQWLFYEKESGELVSDDYPKNKWFEVEHLSTDLTEPKVIIEDHHCG